MAWGTGKYGSAPWGGAAAPSIDGAVPSLLAANGGVVVDLLGAFSGGREYYVDVGGNAGSPVVRVYSGRRGKGTRCLAAADGTRLPFVAPPMRLGVYDVRVEEVLDASQTATAAALLTYVQPAGRLKVFRLRAAFPRSAYPLVGRRSPADQPTEDWQT